MAAKSHYLQIRISLQEKALIRRLAERAGQDVSSYVRSRALPLHEREFHELLRSLVDQGEGESFVLAELNDFLCGLAPLQFSSAVQRGDVADLSSLLQNYVSAMVEQAARRNDVPAPSWTSRVPPLERPYFAVPFTSLRPHLLKSAPVPFKRRNIFVDSALGDRV